MPPIASCSLLEAAMWGTPVQHKAEHHKRETSLLCILTILERNFSIHTITLDSEMTWLADYCSCDMRSCHHNSKYTTKRTPSARLD